MKNNFWVKTADIIIVLIIVITIILLVLLPVLVHKYSELTGIQFQNYNLVIIFLYLTALPFTILLVASKRLCKNILNKEPFSQKNITALNVISICAFIDFLLYAAGTILFLRTLLSLILMIAAFMIGLTGLVLTQLIGYAIEIKQENDLTI